MNKISLVVLLVVVPCLLVACAFGYQAHGNLSGVAGEMHGKGYPGNRGGGRFSLSDRDGRLICDGEAFPTQMGGAMGDCNNERGEGVMRCNDGRELAFRWKALSCRAFEGGGEDAQGNRLVFRVERNK